MIPLVSVIYSQCVKSIVSELECRHEYAERRRSRSLFLAYFCQLVVGCALRIIFIAFLEIELFYPRTFPADFLCSIKGVSVEVSHNQTKSANLVHCFTQRAGDKNFWTETVKKADGIFAISAFLEILWILSRVRNGKEFMDNTQFYADHLKSNSDNQRHIARNRGHFAPVFIGQRSMLYCSGIKTKWRRGLRRLIKGETSSIQHTE